jgi:hypothetical protein
MSHNAAIQRRHQVFTPRLGSVRRGGKLEDPASIVARTRIHAGGHRTVAISINAVTLHASLKINVLPSFSKHAPLLFRKKYVCDDAKH